MSIAPILTQSCRDAEECAYPRFLTGVHAHALIDLLCAFAPLRETAFPFLPVSLS